MQTNQNLSSTTLGASLIITTYNSPDRLALVLDSVRDLSPLPAEVIIADDGSTDETRILIESYAKSFPCPLHHIWQEDKGFRASAVRNKGIKAATQDYIIIIDGDMILDPHFIADHLRFAQRGVVLQGSRTGLSASATQEILHAKSQSPSTAYRLAFAHKKAKSYRIGFMAYLANLRSTTARHLCKSPYLKPVVRTCNMSFYKSDWAAVGGFDEGYTGWGREDSDFVARLLLQGGKLKRVTFSAVAYHIYHQSNINPQALAINDKRYFAMLESHGITYPPPPY
ncbi:glycosyltransferase family 2 protein [Helicobacter sp.]|uniref:glycosyltransferase family 2 protein n=1 Tax=Helicobacter sp. TaxID=218 RepID=UPI00388ED60F